MKTTGFTLVELLVVVLIIGILSSVALPQYHKAVDKSRVATILPLMRRWSDALSLYKLENGSYVYTNDTRPSADELGVSWPDSWECYFNGTECENNLWYCFPNEEGLGEVYCQAKWKENEPHIYITQPDDIAYPAGKKFCFGNESFCKSLGGKALAGYDGYYEF